MAIFDPRLAANPASVPLAREVPLTGFGGLNIVDDAEEVGWSGAVDLLNVDFDVAGRVRSRDGSTSFYAESAMTTPTGLAFFTSAAGTTYLVEAGSGTPGLRLINSSASSVATQNFTPSLVTKYNFARIGTPSTAYLYICDGGGAVRRTDGATFSTPAADGYDARAVGSSPTDNRLVVTDGPHRVRFSNAGDPETFDANDYVDLTPGDGETIAALVAWRELLFAFKQTKFFVFYGNSTDATGNPVFNYRAVDAGTGLWAQVFRGATAGPDGVYFTSLTGIYRTTGGLPVEVSRPIRPVFGLVVDSGYWQGSARTLSPSTGWFGRRLYIEFDGDVYVYDPATEAWTFWTLPSDVRGLAGTPDDVAGWTYGMYFTTSAGVSRFSTATTDNGTAITSRYRTGFSDLGGAASEKILREVLLDGSGTVGVSVAVNDAETVPAATSVALGTAPAVANNRLYKSSRGRNFSLQLASVSGGAWQVARAVGRVMGERAHGEKSG